MTESDIQQLVQAQGMTHNIWLLRNNNGAFEDKTGRWVRYGLGNVSKKVNKIMKSSDLIGITSIVITPDMVGRTIGVFTAIEVKDINWKPSEKDQRYIAQRNFINIVKSKGGIGDFVNDATTLKHLKESYILK
jgi:hypothetical protein